ncbi:MAG: ABC transporter ATP-binding protein [Candidatus Eisenbacteria bacterium]
MNTDMDLLQDRRLSEGGPAAPRPTLDLSRERAAVWVKGLTRTFEAGKRKDGKRTVTAVAGIDLAIGRGELFGILGPNGAGKTTTMKILTTLLYPTTGEVRVAGYDVVLKARDVRRRIGLVSGGDNAGYGILTVRESLWMFSQFYGVPQAESRERSEMLLDRLALREKADERVNRLSTGFKQRLNFARGFMSDPEIVFLDEPTLGLDVESARHVRLFLRDWMAERPGERTVLLTTHYMAEADELCDRIAIIDRGKILATDTPQGLRQIVSADRRVEVELDAGTPIDALSRIAGVRVLRVTPPTERGTFAVHLGVGEGRGMRAVLDSLMVEGRAVHNLSTHDPSLEDVFVAIVGRGLDETVAPRIEVEGGGTA